MRSEIRVAKTVSVMEHDVHVISPTFSSDKYNNIILCILAALRTTAQNTICICIAFSCF